MDTAIIDRRLAGKNKSIGNVERFNRRFQKHRDALAEKILREGKIGDFKDTEGHIPKKDLEQPVFHHTSGGTREIVHPGNTEYIKGDKIKRPEGGAGQGKGGTGGSGDGEDSFTFTLTKEDLKKYFFDQLGLPNMIRKSLSGDADQFRSRRAGYQSEGSANNLDVVRSMREALKRRTALDAPHKKHLIQLQHDFDAATDEREKARIQIEIDFKKARKPAAFLDPIDLRYRRHTKTPVPTAKAVIFRLMDVSGSMDEQNKADAKFFYILLSLFLEQKYDKIEVHNIRYHNTAKDCDEQEFFYGKDTGGTTVSSALKLMLDTIEKKYGGEEWNIYGALASDGDHGGPQDSAETTKLMKKILNLCQYFAYIEIAQTDKPLGDLLKTACDNNPKFAMQRQVDRTKIFPVFRELFRKEGFEEEPHRRAALSAPAYT